MLYFDELDSTNNKARELGEAGEPHMTAVVADKQTAGKGRRGRTWNSPAGENLYMSILVRPKLPPEKVSMLTLVIGYSVAEVLRSLDCGDVMVKWPNDLVLSGKKICGILTELHLPDYFAVIGLGINVNQVEIPAELCDKATSLKLETGKTIDRQELAKKVLKAFDRNYKLWEEAGNLEPIRERYNEILINRGKTVRVLDPKEEYEAFAMGITPEGELLVELPDGTQRKVYAGEVSVRGVLGYV